MAEWHRNKEIRLKRAHSSHTGEGLAVRHHKPEMTHFVILHFADSMGDVGNPLLISSEIVERFDFSEAPGSC